MADDDENPDFFLRAFGFYNNCLEGSTVLVQAIKIAKATIEPIMVAQQSQLPAQDNSDETEEEADELLNLSKANMSHHGLCVAVKAQRALESRNKVLKRSRDLFQSLDVHFPEGCLRFKLENHGRIENRVDGRPEWILELPDECTVPLCSIGRVGINLANVPLSSPSSMFGRNRWTENGALVIRHTSTITTVFVPDKSWNQLLDIEDFDFIEYGRHRLLSAEPGVTTFYEGPEPDLTMRLVLLSIEIDTIQDHLDVLGIDTSKEEDE